MSAASRARFAQVVQAEPVDVGLACLLVGCEVDPDLDVDLPLAHLDALAALARPLVPPGAPPELAAVGLRAALEGYRGSAPDYADLRSSLLHEVLVRQRGLPLLLSVLWVEVAQRVGVAAYCVALPGHVVVGIGDPEDAHVHVDPYEGGRPLDLADLDRLVRAATGRPLRPQDLRATPAAALLLRLLANIRAVAGRQEQLLAAARVRLWATELSLLLPSHPLALRRERGELLVRLGDHLGGAAVLEQYAAVVADADPEASRAAAREAGLARSRLN